MLEEGGKVGVKRNQCGEVGEVGFAFLGEARMGGSVFNRGSSKFAQKMHPALFKNAPVAFLMHAAGTYFV